MASFSTSERFTLCWADAIKIGRYVVVAALGAALNEFVTQVAHLDFGAYQALADSVGMVLGAGLVESLRRWITDFSHA